MAPAQQGFAARDFVVLKTDAGLVVNLEPAVRDGLAQIYFQLAACLDLNY
jgi:hypothetical protein